MTHLGRTFGDQEVLKNVCLEISAGEKIGLIGENGAGKSTLLRLLAKLDQPDTGHIERSGSVALLTQHTEIQAGTVAEAMMPPGLRTAQNAFQEALQQLQEQPEALATFAEAEENYRLAGGYEFEAKAQAILDGLQLEAQQAVNQLSGGQIRRMMLAQLLISPADLYLLDEPTNHLDLAGIQWLTEWILASEAAFLLSSHNRAFLDDVTEKTVELERTQLSMYTGAYSAAMQEKSILREAQERDYQAFKRKETALKQQHNRLRSASSSADQFSHKRAGNTNLMAAKNKAQDVSNTLARHAKALERRLERLAEDATEKPHQDRRLTQLKLMPISSGPSEVLTIKDLCIQRDEKHILKQVNLHVRRGDRIALTGPNGGGKTTLLQALMGQIPYSGTLTWGQPLTHYVASQHQQEVRCWNNIAEALLEANPDLTPHQLYELSASVQLPKPSFPISALSGGQFTRLALACLSVTRAQVIILDEPTNHLDIRMIEALEDVLANFTGTLLFASHDRALIQKIATRIWRVEDGLVVESQ